MQLGIDKPEFPWNFLANPDGPDQELAANWIFLHLRGKAYRGYLDAGPGVLVGPFLSDEDDAAISSEEASRRHAAGKIVGLAVMYLPVYADIFAHVLPDESLRRSIREAAEGYDPKTQCVVLLRHDETALLARVIGVPDDPSGIHTPRATYFRELLERATDTTARPN